MRRIISATTSGRGRAAAAILVALFAVAVSGCNPYGDGDRGSGKVGATLHAGVVVPGHTGTRHDPAAQLIDPDWRSMSIYVFPADLDGEVHELHLSGTTTQGEITGLDPDVMYAVEVRVEVEQLGGDGDRYFDRPTEDLIFPVVLEEGDNHLTLTLLRGHWVFDEPVALPGVGAAMVMQDPKIKGFSLVQLGRASESSPMVSLNGTRLSHNEYRVLWHYDGGSYEFPSIELGKEGRDEAHRVVGIDCEGTKYEKVACSFHVPGRYAIDLGQGHVGLMGGQLPLDWSHVNEDLNTGRSFDYISRSVGFLAPLQIVDGATLQGHLHELVVDGTVIAEWFDDDDCPPGHVIGFEEDGTTMIRNYRHPADGECMKETIAEIISHPVTARGHPISISTDPFGLGRGDLRPMMEQASLDWAGEVVRPLTIFGDYYELGGNEQDGQLWSGGRPPAAAAESRLTNGQWLYFLMVRDRGLCEEYDACFMIERMRFDLASNQWVVQEYVFNESPDYYEAVTLSGLNFTTKESQPLLAVGGHLRLMDKDGEHYSVLEAKAIDLSVHFPRGDAYLDWQLVTDGNPISCDGGGTVLAGPGSGEPWSPTVCGMIEWGGPIVDEDGYGPRDRTWELGSDWKYCLQSAEPLDFDDSDIAIVAPVSEHYRRGFIVPFLNGSAMDKVVSALLDCPH